MIYFNNIISKSSQTYCRLQRSPIEITLWRLMMTTGYNITRSNIFRAGWWSEMCYLKLVSCLQQVWWGFAVFLNRRHLMAWARRSTAEANGVTEHPLARESAPLKIMRCVCLWAVLPQSALIYTCGVAICLIKALKFTSFGRSIHNTKAFWLFIW